MFIFSYPSVLTYVLGAQKNRLPEMVLLSTYNLCLSREIRKLNFPYALLFLTEVLFHRQWGSNPQQLDPPSNPLKTVTLGTVVFESFWKG